MTKEQALKRIWSHVSKRITNHQTRYVHKEHDNIGIEPSTRFSEAVKSSTKDTNRYIQIGKEVMDVLLAGWRKRLWTSLKHFGPPNCLSFRCIVVSVYCIFRCVEGVQQGQNKANNGRLRLSLSPTNCLHMWLRNCRGPRQSQTGFVSFSFELKINGDRAVVSARWMRWEKFLFCRLPLWRGWPYIQDIWAVREKRVACAVFEFLFIVLVLGRLTQLSRAPVRPSVIYGILAYF